MNGQTYGQTFMNGQLLFYEWLDVPCQWTDIIYEWTDDILWMVK